MVNTTATSRAGGTTIVIVSIVVVLTLAGAAALFLSGGAEGPDASGAADEYEVTRGSFDITIPASGELAALQQIEIRNLLEYRAVITEIIDEGASVKKGDILLRLADDEIRNKIKDAVDEVNTSQAALIGAQSDLEIKLSQGRSELDQANLAVMLSELALQAWKEGEVESKRQELALELETAEKDHDRLFRKYEESKVLVDKQFISQDEFRTDEIRMIEAKARLEQAKLGIRVYENFQYKQDEAQKQSDLDQAVAERARVEERHKAEIETARAELTSKEYQFQSRKERLADLNQQLEYCTVRAPADGWVVYASSLESGRSWRNEGESPTVGTEVHRNDLVMILPDTTQMIASVKVNEALSGLIQPGQAAVVTTDAVEDIALSGQVISIGALAESGGWIDRNRRDYTVKIRLDRENDLGLKPSMRCKAEIRVGEVDDAVHVPLQAVFRNGAAAYVYVPQGRGFAQRRLKLGRASGLHVEVIEGLDEGEIVLLREPEVREIVARIDDERARGAKGRGDRPPEEASARAPQGSAEGG